ncbi:MAG: response regulator [Proteobacteria bacterium]|nr:response regulator [Pseudomonadota bacterium]
MSSAGCVVVVDDDPVVTRMLELALRAADLEVVTTNRSFGVLNLIASTKPEVVIMDLMMPGLDGAELTDLIRRDPDTAGAVVIMYSAADESTLEQRGRQCGADAWLPKTTRPSALVSEVMRWISLGRG